MGSRSKSNCYWICSLLFSYRLPRHVERHNVDTCNNFCSHSDLYWDRNSYWHTDVPFRPNSENNYAYSGCHADNTLFVYLIPVVMLLGIGKVPGLLAVCIYALPPIVRLTNLGIRLVDKEVLEASRCLGANAIQRLIVYKYHLRYQHLRRCKPDNNDGSIYGGDRINDWCKRTWCSCIAAVSNQYLALGLMNGLAIVALAIIFDRVTQQLGKRLQKHQGLDN